MSDHWLVARFELLQTRSLRFNTAQTNDKSRLVGIPPPGRCGERVARFISDPLKYMAAEVQLIGMEKMVLRHVRE